MRTRRLLPEPVGGGRGRAHRRPGPDRAEGRAAGRARSAERGCATQSNGSDGGGGGSDGRAGTELRRPGDEPRGDRRPENSEPEKRQAGEHQAHRLADVRLRSAERAKELAEEARADADDDRQHHHLDTRADHIAEHALGQEAGAVPQGEGHEDEPGETGQLELEDGDEQLHREDEEGDDDEQPGEQQDGDRHEILEEAGEAEQLAGLVEQRPGGLEPGAGEIAGAKQVRRAHRPAAGGQPEPRERLEDDVRQGREIAENQGERPDVEDLLEEAADEVVLAAHRPEQAGQRDVDADQHRRQEGDIAPQQPEPAVDVLDEGRKELVDDAKVVHFGSLSLGWGAAGPRGSAPRQAPAVLCRRRARRSPQLPGL